MMTELSFLHEVFFYRTFGASSVGLIMARADTLLSWAPEPMVQVAPLVKIGEADRKQLQVGTCGCEVGLTRIWHARHTPRGVEGWGRQPHGMRRHAGQVNHAIDRPLKGLHGWPVTTHHAFGGRGRWRHNISCISISCSYENEFMHYM